MKLPVYVASMLLMTRQVMGAGAPVSYKTNGADWDKICKTGKTQSGIDLKTTLTPKTDEKNYFHYENVMGDKDKLYVYGYKDDKGVAKTEPPQGTLHWSDGSSAVYVQLDNSILQGVATDPTQLPSTIPSKAKKFHNTPNWFESSYAKDYNNGLRYYAKQLHFHTKSEHKIDGKLKAFEMHVVHQSAEIPTDKTEATGYPLGKLGVIGILFDPKDYDKDKVSNATIKAIDNFFDNLMYEKLDGKDSTGAGKTIIADEIPLGQLMAMLNLGDRWVYDGSLTTPPCYERVFWNVLTTVYPIKQYHFDYYNKVIQARAQTASDAKTKGNHRVVRDAVALHKVTLLNAKPNVEPTGANVTTAAQNASLALTILFMIFMILSMALTVYVCVLWDEVKKANAADGAEASQVEIGPSPDKTEGPADKAQIA